MPQFERRRPLQLCPRFNALMPMVGSTLLLAATSAVQAAPQSPLFDAAFMRQSAGQPIDAGHQALQGLAANAPLAPGRYQVEVVVNLVTAGSYELALLRAPQGSGLQACLTADLLRVLGLREQALREPLPDDTRCVDLPNLVPQAQAQLDPAQLRLSLSIPQIALRRDLAGSVPIEQWDPGINAAFINYQANAQHSSRQNSSRSSQDLYLNSGINLGAWQLRSSQALRQGLQGERRWTRSNTYARRDLPGLRASLTLGETFSDGEVFRSLPFTGALLASEHDMLPDTLQSYAPVVRGVAQTRAKLEVLHNGYPIYATYVAPGPYEIDDLNLGAGHGELEIVLTEADGQVRRFIQPYASLGNLLREGVWRYNASYGRYKGAEQLASPDFWQATLARGGGWSTTLYGGLMGSDHYQAGAIGIGRDLGSLGGVSFDITHARSDLGERHGKVTGNSFAARYGKSFSSNTSLRFAGYRYSTEGYRDFDEVIQQRHDASGFMGNRRSRLEASVYQNFTGSGSLSLTLTQDDYWNSSYQRRQYQAQYNTRFGQLGVNLFASQALSSQQGPSRVFGVSLSLPLDSPRYRTATFDMQHSNGASSQRASLGGDLLDNRLNYRVSANRDQQRRTSGAVSLGYQGELASLGAGYTQGADFRSVSLNASGTLLAHSQGLTLGNYLGETAALVHVPGVEGVGVQNAGKARTNAQGYLLVPYLRPYRNNTLILDTDDLGPDALIETGTLQLVPLRGAIVKATFAARKVTRLVLTLMQADGRPLPFGATVKDEQGQTLAVVGQAGQALVAIDASEQALRVDWHDQRPQQCAFDIDVAHMRQDGGYHLQTLHCQPR
ncbi:fimbrial biogenesis outer membrane usher protein [Pseudomonas sp. SWRI107]|uniref:fimbria/pilus outer membrane usher protein n=1 Tax=Pseudomonas farsensis TaxID=2745492 RepID=UPI001649142A|nr:fimbria/pilus outer membrane usher protein [Pseudomonas farsensis]MBV4530569.1 fimbrial biogenesis outer membrane usher protein [Pseudomonas farsensis]